MKSPRWVSRTQRRRVLLTLLGLCLIFGAHRALAQPVPVQSGILWDIPPWLEPNMTLAHPRVQYTVDGLQRARAKLDNQVAWAHMLYDKTIRQADAFTYTDEQIRHFMPPQYSYFKNTDDMVPCPDGSSMVPSWGNPGKVRCGTSLLPDDNHPDDGRGWKDEKGQTHYFVARWNGFVVQQFTEQLWSLSMAYALSNEERYAHRAAVILDALATIYPTATEGPLDFPGAQPGLEGGRLERPQFQVGRVLLIYANVADLIWTSKVMDEPSVTNPGLSVRENITYNLLLNAADYCYREANKQGFINALHNGTADYNKAILAVGSLLGIERYVEWTLNGPTSLATMLSNNIDRDGLYFETTSGYTDAVRTIYLQIADMFYNLRTPRYPEGINYYNDTRFAAFFADSRERLFLAGRSPAYGDTDSDRWVGVGKPINEVAATQIVQFAVRSSDPEARARYWTLVAEGTNNVPLFSYNNEWGLFNIDTVPETITAVQRTMPNAEVLGGKGIALLRSGDDRGAFIRYGAMLLHGQRDQLGLNLYTHGREMAFDPGYGMAHYLAGWTSQTVSHVTTVVNERGQQGSGGSLNFIASGPGLGVTEAHDEGAYAHQGVSVYRRLISLVDSSPDESYLVDIFRVKGGSVRDYSFHSWGTKLGTTGLEFGPTQPGSVASPAYSWHNQIGVDQKVVPHQHQGYSWSAPPGNGYGFLGNPRTAIADTSWSATWDNGDRKLKLMMLPTPGREVIVADAPSPMAGAQYLLAREKGDTPSQFVSVIDMTQRNLQVAHVDRLTITTASEGDFAPVAFMVTLADPIPQVQDIFLSSLNGSFTAEAHDTRYVTDAEFASVRKQGADIQALHVVKGTFISAGPITITDFPIAYTGTIVSVDYQNGSILLATPNPIPQGIASHYALISAAEYSQNSPYQIKRVEQEGAYTRLYLFPTAFELAKGFLSSEPQGKSLPNMNPLNYCNLGYRSSTGDYYNGKAVINENGSMTLIEQVENNRSGLIVEDVTGFSAGDRLTIYDIKAGDTVSIPVSIHLTKADSLTYELQSPLPVWLSIAGKNDTDVYVEDTDGTYIQAHSEIREGTRWFHIPPGRVVFQKAGRVVGSRFMEVSDDKTIILHVQVEELATLRPVTDAAVTAILEERLLEFIESSPGVYTAQLPAGMRPGSHSLNIQAEKDGIALYPLEVRLNASAHWSLNAPDRLEVGLGLPIEFQVMVEGTDPALLTVVAGTEEQQAVITPEGLGVYTMKLAPITSEQKVKVHVSRHNGFTQEATVVLQPTGGRIVPLQQELRVKANQDAAIPVRFVVGNRVLSGDNIPYSYATYGFMSFADFSDTDDDGLATAVVNLHPGTYVMHVQAEGYENCQITVIAE